MNPAEPSHYVQVILPRLSTSKVLCRRDSLSSSKTRDSGYNSDLDTLTPLDVFGPDQDTIFAPLPCDPDIFVNSEALPPRRRRDSDKPQTLDRSCVTSTPASASTSTDRKQTVFKLSSVPESIKFQDRSTNDFISHSDDIERWIKDNLPSGHRPEKRVSSIISLSSTSSCDMYTNTDVSADEAENENKVVHNVLPRSTRKIIVLILRKVEANLSYAAYKQCTNSSTTRNKVSFASKQGGGSSTQNLGHKRKFWLEGSPPPEDDDGDGTNKRRRGSATTTDDSETGVRFACPFYKHDPDRYRSKRTCPGPGWTTVHRVKEHLYRSHAQPIFCPICYSTFKSDKEQLEHVRLQQCQRSAPQQIEGIDRETIWTLRKRTTALRLEEDKWRDAYQILFPNVDVADIPSPFYDCDSPSESSRRFRRELLRRVQEELFLTSNLVPNPVEQQLLQRVAHIIRRCEEDILNPHPSHLDTYPSDRRASNVSTISTVSMTEVTDHIAPIPMPTPPSAGHEPSLSSGVWGNSSCPIPIPVTMQFMSQPSTDFGPVVWNEQGESVFGLGIDWEGMFPPGPEDTAYPR